MYIFHSAWEMSSIFVANIHIVNVAAKDSFSKAKDRMVIITQVAQGTLEGFDVFLVT